MDIEIIGEAKCQVCGQSLGRSLVIDDDHTRASWSAKKNDPENNTPKFTHDCTICVFLGTVQIARKDYDLYYHPGSMETVIARFGNDGPEYLSGMSSGKHDYWRRNGSNTPLGMAYQLSQFLKTKKYIEGDLVATKKEAIGIIDELIDHLKKEMGVN